LLPPRRLGSLVPVTSTCCRLRAAAQTLLSAWSATVGVPSPPKHPLLPLLLGARRTLRLLGTLRRLSLTLGPVAPAALVTNRNMVADGAPAWAPVRYTLTHLTLTRVSVDTRAGATQAVPLHWRSPASTPPVHRGWGTSNPPAARRRGTPSDLKTSSRLQGAPPLRACRVWR